MKGIVLAGGSGSRLSPLTDIISKHLLPVYNKPMIFYPLSILIDSGIKEILIISTEEHIGLYKSVLDRQDFGGVDLSYCVQKAPNGLPEAFIIGEEFIGDDNVTLILGDNLFVGTGVSERISDIGEVDGGVIFGKRVPDPERFGVAVTDEYGNVMALEEKPENPQSDLAVVGLYVYDSSVVERSKNLSPSKRGELEITDLNLSFLNDQKLKLIQLDNSVTWLDTGTFDSLLEAGQIMKNYNILYNEIFNEKCNLFLEHYPIFWIILLT